VIRLLQLLIFGHVHKWKMLESRDYEAYVDEVGKGEPSRGKLYMLQCEHCGSLKRVSSIRGG
jgi:hypothetical protein